MLVVPINELIAGDKLAQGLLTTDGRLLLKQGSILNERLIEGIKKLGRRYIGIEPTGPRANAGSNFVLRCLMGTSADLLLQVSQSLHKGARLPIEAIAEWASLTALAIQETDGLSLNLGNLKGGGTEWIQHSVNVCMLSLLAAKGLGYTNVQMEEVAIGGLLHDIGLVLPFNHSLMLHHPVIGYEFLRKYRSMPQDSLLMVLQHHEQIDGRGFPKGTSGPEMLEAAQICGLASEFDYFVNDSAKERLPSEGIEMAMAKIGTHYSYGVVRAFIGAIQPYPVGTEVMLSGGLIGKVDKVGTDDPCRPVVRLSDNVTCLDLMSQVSFRIEKVTGIIH